jgi:hypothetical protein
MLFVEISFICIKNMMKNGSRISTIINILEPPNIN